MLDLMSSLAGWHPVASGQRCAVATVVGTSGSVPRPMGTSMMVSAAGDVLGSLSGGCVEGAVVEAALEAMRDGGTRLELFGYSAEDAFAVGLTCGGELQVHIEPFGAFAGPSIGQLLRRLPETPVALIRRVDLNGSGAVVIPDPEAFKAAQSAELAALLGLRSPAGEAMAAAAAQLEPLLRGGRTGLVRLAPAGGCVGRADVVEESGGIQPEPVTLLVESRTPPPRMLVFGANDFGAALVPAAKLLGYSVTLIDARPAFAGQARFETADEVVTDWPHRYLAAEAAATRIDARTAICVLTHDPKFDIPLLEAALGLDVAFVGAMGSRRSHRQRIDALLAAGVPPEGLARLHSPIGLDLGAVTPAEVAVSITAELIAARNAAAACAPLRDGSGPIHHANEESQETPWT
ncbi:putative xanthine dehydrogenase subunit A [Arthrobacter sp. Bi83]|uniref:XdhC family protein n=1 Tax=Arthrobacter sp. Bi83 TaxID=2822353 RepID=UPI001D5F5089|nr:XdhC/CoxI family protein [Arthrobacter sp. Bi83]CAH0294311.1 putative xanthine dehydrogenase subunit A [Arthrobacter sp. Bi83]